MMSQHKVEFGQIEWESPMQGVRHKYLDQDHNRMRLVEYFREMPPHWCEKAHYGYVFEGRLEIEYHAGKVVYEPGDGIFIPEGPDHRHRATVLTDKVLVFFVQKV